MNDKGEIEGERDTRERESKVKGGGKRERYKQVRGREEAGARRKRERKVKGKGRREIESDRQVKERERGEREKKGEGGEERGREVLGRKKNNIT